MNVCGNIYQVDTLIQLNVTFLNVPTNMPADPTAVSLFISDPSGNETEVTYNPGPIVRTGVGVYYYQFTPTPTPPATTAAGTWTYKWQGTGAVIATSRDTNFLVQASDLIQ